MNTDKEYNFSLKFYNTKTEKNFFAQRIKNNGHKSTVKTKKFNEKIYTIVKSPNII